MAKECFSIYDNQTGLWLTAYSEPIEYCMWGNENDAICFISEEERDKIVGELNLNTLSRFIGQNPKPR